MTLISNVIEDSMISNEVESNFPKRDKNIQFVAAVVQQQSSNELGEQSIGAIFESTKPKCDECGNNLTGTECLDCAKQTIL